MKLTKEQRDNYLKFFKDSINICDYDNFKDHALQPENDVQKLFLIFKYEMSSRVTQIGFLNAFTEWLQGLPGCIDIPFSNYDILQLALKMGSLKDLNNDKEEQKILDNYWNFSANYFMKLFKKEKLI